MSDRGTMDWVAAKIGDIERIVKETGDKRLDAFTGLLSSIESSLADIVDNIERAGGAAAIEKIAEGLQRMKLPDVSFNPTIERPQVNVSATSPAVNVTNKVEPTPVQVNFEAVMPPMPDMPAPIIHVLERADIMGATWEIRIPGQYGGADRVMTLKRIA